MTKYIGFIVGLILSVSSMAQEQVDFRVEIPDSWKLISHSAEETLWAYESNDGKHRLTVSVLYYSSEPSHAQQGEFLNDFLKTRQQQSSKIADGITFDETKINEYEGAWVAKFTEFSTSGRVATNKAISSRIGIANFYFESFTNSKTHEEASSHILSTTGFAS